MPGSMTGAASRWCLEFLFGKAMKWTGTRTQYVMLLTAAAPSDDPVLSSLTEVSAPGYARQPLSASNLASAVTDPTTYAGSIENSAQLTFGPFTSSTGIGTPATYAALVSPASSMTGDVMFVWQLDTAGFAAQNESLAIPASSLMAGLD